MNPTPWVLVTGGAKRLGREFCLAFARAGWNVLCHFHSSRQQALQTQADVQALGRQCRLLRQELSSADAASALLDMCVTETGTLPRCIVNNASLFEEDDAFSAHAGQLLAHMQANAFTPLLLGNALAGRLRSHGGDTAGEHCVVHVLDQKVHNLNPDYFSYTVSKLALERSVALQAQALAPWVRVCGLSPGLIYLSGPQTQDNFERASQINLLKRQIDPVDVAKTAVFFADNRGITGCTVQVDNGQHLVPLERDVMFAIQQGGPA